MRIAIVLFTASLIAARAGAQQPSPTALQQKAFRLSLWGTLIPVAAGTIIWARQAGDAWASEGSDRTGAALLVGAGLTFGPAFGYSSAGLAGRGGRGVALRLGLTLLSVGSAYGICGWNCSKGDAAYEVAWIALATGTGLGAASAVYDIARVRHNVRQHEARSRATVSLAPFYSPDQQKLGIRVDWSF